MSDPDQEGQDAFRQKNTCPWPVTLLKIAAILAAVIAIVLLAACSPAPKLSIAPIRCLGCLPAYPDMQREQHLMEMHQNTGHPV